MKIKIDIDCTPGELRAFFGLPDLAPLEAELVEAMRARLADGIRPEDMEAMMRAWMSGAGAGLEQFQKMLFAGLSGKTAQES